MTISLPTRNNDGDENWTPSPHHDVLGWSLTMVTLCFHSFFPHSFRLNKEDYIKDREEVLLLWIKRVAAGRPYVWQKDYYCHFTQAGKRSLGCQIISAITSPRTSGCQTLQITILLIVMSGRLFRARLTNHCAKLKINWRQG